MYQFQGKKLSQYMSRFNVCRIYMSDNDFINRHLESYKKTPFYDTSKDVSCTKEAFEKLDRETKTLVKMLKPDDKSYWNSLISQCLDNYSSDEEFKKSFLRIMYELNKNKLLNLKQEECINNLTHEQLQLIKQNDKKMLKGLQPKRADIITSGVKILHIIMEKLEFEEIMISEYDNLEGLMCQKSKNMS